MAFLAPNSTEGLAEAIGQPTGRAPRTLLLAHIEAQLAQCAARSAQCKWQSCVNSTLNQFMHAAKVAKPLGKHYKRRDVGVPNMQ